MLRRLAAALALTTLLWLPTATPPPAVQAASCTAWPSARIPPTTIRVLRTGTGYVQVVNFKTYVQKVEAAEFAGASSTQWLRLGAIAVKQYGWYFAMHYRGGRAHGACYDVKDNTSDQVYQESRTPSAAMIAAIDATWAETVTKGGSFLMTSYRSKSASGSSTCGQDPDGSHLWQLSAKDCITQGMTADQILGIYYFPAVAIWTPSPTPAAAFISPADRSQVTAGTTASVSWTEEPTSPATITSRLVSLVSALPVKGSCAVDRWVPASPAWQSAAASPQTVTGLKVGFCYRLVVALTDSNDVVTSTRSGTILVGPAAATATFTSPTPNVVTAVTVTTATVRWTETPAAGTHVVGRVLTTEIAAQAVAGTCAGANWGNLSSTTAASPVTVGGPGRLFCYRYRLTLTDSAGHVSNTYSGILRGPSA